MGKKVSPLGQLNIRKSVLGLTIGAGAVYLLYKAIRTGMKCQQPLSTSSPTCIARECLGPGGRTWLQEDLLPEASSVGGPKGDSKFLLSLSLFHFP